MLEYEKIDVSEGIDVNKLRNKSRKCELCHFWYFLDKSFHYQKYYCNSCHDMSMKAVSINNFAVIYSKGNAYRVNFAFISLGEVNKLMNNSNLNNKGSVIIDFGTNKSPEGSFGGTYFKDIYSSVNDKW